VSHWTRYWKSWPSMSWLSMVLSSLGQTIAGEIGVGDGAAELETPVDDTTSADGTSAVGTLVTVAEIVVAVIVAFTV
jgi:hypothetical protein